MSKIPFHFIRNARDLGGYLTADGRITIPNKIIRSAVVSEPDDYDIALLKNDLHVDKIVDLRSLDECEQNPDLKIDGIEYVWLPIFRHEKENEAFSRLKEDEYHISFVEKMERLYERNKGFSIYQHMIQNYLDFVTQPYIITQYKKLLKLLLEEKEENALLYHCAGGKDRTGGASLIILALLGVSKEDIKYDYMLTAENVREINTKTINEAKLDTTRPYLAEILDGCLNAHEIYIDSVINYMEEKEGDLISYLKKYFSITDQEIKTLRDKYLKPL